MFLNMTEVLIVPEVAHDACGVVKYLVNLVACLVRMVLMGVSPVV